MYYFRDSFFNQQVAYGVARSVQIRRFGRRSTLERTVDLCTQVFASIMFLALTFTVSYMLLDAMGFENLTTFYVGDRLSAALGLEGLARASL